MTEEQARLNQLIDDYFDKRAKHDELKQAKTEAYVAMKRAEAAVTNELVENQWESGPRRADGTQVALSKYVNVSVTQENMSDIRGWLLDEFGDDHDYVEEVVSKKALLDKVRTMIDVDDKIPEDFPPFMKVSTTPKLSVRGWNQRTENA